MKPTYITQYSLRQYYEATTHFVELKAGDLDDLQILDTRKPQRDDVYVARISFQRHNECCVGSYDTDSNTHVD